MCGKSQENRVCRKCDFHCRHNFGSKGCFHCMQVSYSGLHTSPVPHVRSMMITNSKLHPSHKIDFSEEMNILSQSVHQTLALEHHDPVPQTFTEFVKLFNTRHQSEPESIPEVSKTPVDDSKVIPKRKRCHQCAKKLPLTAFPCHCDEFFCDKHRYSNEHDCSYDYKSEGKRKILENNPKIVAKKLIQF
ncbi:hypothetical protein TCAL_05006 [Tigriopus californicus]|uniref:AN1-type domain-containing protein n=1 Tax=Tigriopus californicus TaxID=6832 RepID=A0A553PMQ7_TIGCA|nr:AN1-type zinc finger protein 5-like [Tigriopus californicus]TRY78946.1 hypothetical protein TCAL_05006 [Tigriopus californicus]|eukprot:TCALIF_05006-PA protein Name:"Similar to SAP5 Zinc finger A20 and AN1 domain-containing stress-associated protein 5 (Arabidopsis thaliana)" AED:0.11 eAED:0.11 QI:0/-1/0/1/-1/1/1/0/188